MLLKEAENAMGSIVTIIHGNEERPPRFGSGFVIKTRGDESVIMTCRHCVKEFKPNDTLHIRYVVGDDVRELPAAILFVSESDADVALIRVDGLPALPPLRFSEEDLLIDQETVTVGNCRPDLLWEEEDEWAIPKYHASSPGRVKGFRSRPRVVCVKMKGVSVNGMSGCPTLSRKGVSGILSEGKPGYCLAITTEEIKAVLGIFLHKRNIPFRSNATIHQLLHIMPLR